MNKQQKEYIQTKKALADSEEVLAGREKSFLEHRGIQVDRLWQIEDERAFDALLIEFYEDPEIVAMEEDTHQKRDAMKEAEEALIEYALGISPAGVRETLRKGAATQAKIRRKLVDMVMALNTNTVH